MAASLQQSASDKALSSVRLGDAASRDVNGKLTRLTAAEHMRRADIYMANRAFAEAREHWQAVLDFYPQDSRVPEALLGIGRSYFQSRRYDEAFSVFDRLRRNYSSTKEGREGLNFSAASLLRLGRFSEAANRYMEYTNRFPSGERIETAYLNVIDTLREAGQSKEALTWVTKTRAQFSGLPNETNALFAQLRLYVAESKWPDAIVTSEQLLRMNFQKGVTTTPAEVAYLKAFSLEQAGKKEEAFSTYMSIPDSINSYYGWRATEKMLRLAGATRSVALNDRVAGVKSDIAASESEYPAPYRQAILKTARARKLDPRFVLALMRQESVFRPFARSQAGARGLLQLTFDAAQKYAIDAGLTDISESQLYQPETSIRLGVEYLGQLSKLFPQTLEAVTASYNGGEDNVGRWVKRARQDDPGVFTAEIGFDETKSYVQKVMANYRVYRELYTADLIKR